MVNFQRLFKSETLIFICFLVLNLVNVWSTSVYVSMDGPGHLYSAGLLNYIDKSEFLQGFYEQNNFLAPNYLSNYFLSKLFYLFDPLTAEKLYLSVIVLALPVSFRILIKKLNPKGTDLSFMIFSLVFTFLFQYGFFNFTLAFVFLNLLLAFSIDSDAQRVNVWQAVGLISVSLVLFFTHAFVYAVALLSVFTFLFVKNMKDLKGYFKKAGKLFIYFLPSILMFLVFYWKINFINYPEDIPSSGKWYRLYSFQPAIAHSVEREGVFALILSILIYSLAVLALVNRFIIAKSGIKGSDIFFLFSVILVPVMFYTTSGRYVGMFTDRLAYLFFYFLIIWICSEQMNLKYLNLFLLIPFTISYINLSFKRHDTMEQIAPHARSIYSAASYIKERSLIYQADLSSMWLEAHFSNYAGINKEVVITENYEASLGWFPLKWKQKIFEVKCEVNEDRSLIPDYVLLFGDMNLLNSEAKAGLKYFVEHKAFKLFESNDKYCRLYKVFKTS